VKPWILALVAAALTLPSTPSVAQIPSVVGPFTATGTAFLGVPTAAFDARLEWDGAGVYAVDLFEPKTGTPVHHNQVAGVATPDGFHVAGPCLWHHFFKGSSPGLPDPVFSYAGTVTIDPCAETERMDLSGFYLGLSLRLQG
jgi:hypothetical protein